MNQHEREQVFEAMGTSREVGKRIIDNLSQLTHQQMEFTIPWHGERFKVRVTPLRREGNVLVRDDSAEL
jgi:hypothetical protein